MKWTKSFIYTLKEAPSDAEIASHKLMVRSGLIKKLAPGIYTYSPLGLRAIRKFENIVREEMNAVDSVELLMPMVQPAQVWEESGRWATSGDMGLLKFKNRNEQEFCLGPTHEEVITDFVKRDVKSYRDLPKSLYQIQTKYRDEIRPRFGLMRGREFIMKDAYSFDRDQQAAYVSYDKMYGAYRKIFSRLGADFRVVDADSGSIGGNKSNEFHILAESGEDHILAAEQGEFAANVEVCPAIDAEDPKSANEDLRPVEEFATPNLRTIADLAEFMGRPESELVKTLFFDAAVSEKEFKPIAVLVRGCDELNVIKLKKHLDLPAEPRMLTDEEVRKVTGGASPGSCGPVGLSIPVYQDNSVAKMKNIVVGANKDDVHLKHVNQDRDFKVAATADLRFAKAGDKNPAGDGLLTSYRGIEVGHVFYLGTKYSKAMKADYLDENGKAQVMEMGCYGIGITRTVQAVVEQNHDADGIIWPLAIAPYAVHVCLLDAEDQTSSDLADQLTEKLEAVGLDVLVDDRKERPGVKFKDADLLGMPVRVVIGKRSLERGVVEVVDRKSREKSEVEPDKILGFIQDLLKG